MWICPEGWSDPSDGGLPATPEARRLKSLFLKYGSDKVTLHDYHLVYGFLLLRAPSGALVEFGIASSGTQDDSVIGESETLAPSLRAWSDTLNFTQIFGIDIDERFFVSTNHISCFQADQHDLESLRMAMAQVLVKAPEGIAVVVDDGAHSRESILNTIAASFPCLMPGGWLIVEDLFRTTLQSTLRYALTLEELEAFAIWSNLAKGPSNQMLVLQKRR